MLAKTITFSSVAAPRAPLAGHLGAIARATRAPEPPSTERKRLGGLVLTRHLGESIVVGDSTEVEVVGIKSGTVRLRINAPRDLPVHRREVYEAIRVAPRPSNPSTASDPTRPRPSGQGGLVLTRHEGESIMIGDDVEVIVDDVRPSAIRLRVVAPRSVQVHRQEVFEEIQRGQLAPAVGLGV